MKYRGFYFMFVLLSLGCNSKPKHFETLILAQQFISEPENGFITETLCSNGIHVQVQFIPSAIVNQGTESIGKRYFSIKYAHKGHELLAQLPREEYSSYVQLFSFGMAPYVSLVNEEGKIFEASMVSYQPTYNTTRANELLVVFGDDIPNNQNLELAIAEFGLQTGRLTFSYPKNIINYNPTIKSY